MGKYSIGIDFGTLSARALLVELENGREIAESEYIYPHAILKSDFFDGIRLEDTDALQHPEDYLKALKNTIRGVIESSGVSRADIVGVGIDFTACTVMPVDRNGTPLCFYEDLKNDPHAYVKLWKHHSAEKEACDITSLSKELDEKWLYSYGGKVSSEWLFPKLLEVYRKSRKVYDKTYRFIEAADWLVWKMTGNEVHSSCMAGYKGLWNSTDGFPKNTFWKNFGEDFDVVGTKISDNILETGTLAGKVNEDGEAISGLLPETAVAVPIIDAHAALPAAGITSAGKLMMIIGTSTCHIVMSEHEKNVPGICGRVVGGIIPGLCAYEAGQACVGDSFDWFVKNCVPANYYEAAKTSGKNIFEYITVLAEKLKIGESGLIALDWFNGNRTPLADYSLSGMIMGLTLSTRPEEIFRAILESTAFGTKQIIELYEKNGVEINEVYAAGGISHKNPLLMQIYADVTGKPIKLTASTQAGAKGSAIFASVAGGYFETPDAAAKIISDKCEKIYAPIPENTKKYQKLYNEYITLSDYFGRGANDVMKRLKNI